MGRWEKKRASWRWNQTSQPFQNPSEVDPQCLPVVCIKRKMHLLCDIDNKMLSHKRTGFMSLHNNKQIDVRVIMYPAHCDAKINPSTLREWHHWTSNVSANIKKTRQWKAPFPSSGRYVVPCVHIQTAITCYCLSTWDVSDTSHCVGLSCSRGMKEEIRLAERMMIITHWFWICLCTCSQWPSHEWTNRCAWTLPLTAHCSQTGSCVSFTCLQPQ